MRVQVRLNAISAYQSQQSSPAIPDITVSGNMDTSAPTMRDIFTLAIHDISTLVIRGSSQAKTCKCNNLDGSGSRVMLDALVTTSAATALTVLTNNAGPSKCGHIDDILEHILTDSCNFRVSLRGFCPK
jgi:hypothetical protein